MSGSLLTIALTAADALRLISALSDYRKRIKRVLPAERSVPEGIDDLAMRLRAALNGPTDAGSQGAP